jgi:hypothetical protein
VALCSKTWILEKAFSASRYLRKSASTRESPSYSGLLCCCQSGWSSTYDSDGVDLESVAVGNRAHVSGSDISLNVC